MKARFNATNPEEINFSMNLTMSLKEWEQLRDQIHDKYPGFELASVISNMVVQANKSYWPKLDA